MPIASKDTIWSELKDHWGSLGCAAIGCVHLVLYWMSGNDIVKADHHAIVAILFFVIAKT